MNRLKPHVKAILAGIACAISFAIPVVDDGLAPSEALGIALAGLTGGGVVWRVPNRSTATLRSQAGPGIVPRGGDRRQRFRE